MDFIPLLSCTVSGIQHQLDIFYWYIQDQCTLSSHTLVVYNFPLNYVQEEYEAARNELFEEVARGTSVQDLRAKLTKKTKAAEVKEPSVSETKTIPDELVQIQAFIRWEKAGKPNYSQEQQLVTL